MRQLRVRAGFPPTASLFTKPFMFQANDPADLSARWKNIEQVEAVVEFFVNHRPPGAGPGDPWAPGAAPLGSSDAGYVTVNLGLLQGSSAQIVPGPAGNVIKLDDDADLGDIIVNPPNAANPFLGPAAAGPNLPRPRQFLRDTLWLKDDTGRPETKLFRIMSVDNDAKAKTVTLDPLDVLPKFTGNSDWKIYRRPILVVIDPLGAHRITSSAAGQPTTVWEGTGATIAAADPAHPTWPQDANHPTWTILRLDLAGPPIPSTDSINPGTDTIYLWEDTTSATKPRRTYRIMKVYPARNIAVEGSPTLPAAGSPWHIPAGVSGTTPYLEHNLTPAAGATWDHFDGILLVVHRGEVVQNYRWTSFTSRREAGQNLSSLKGNLRYAYSSYRSPPPGPGPRFRNYNFQIVDAAPALAGLAFNLAADATANARFYFQTQPGAGGDTVPHVTVDANGKGSVRFHRATRTDPSPGTASTGSAGCVVSPDFALLRSFLVKLYESEFRQFYGVTQANVDPELNKLNPSVGPAAAPNFPAQEDIYDRTVSRRHADVAVTEAQNNRGRDLWDGVVAGGLAAADYDGKMCGNSWIIRPDEPPLS